MKASDCPYPVGTPEHSKWIRTVLIPAEERDEDIMAAHRERAGIERLGGSVTWDARDVSPEDELLGIQDNTTFNIYHSDEPVNVFVNTQFYQDLQAHRAFMDDLFKQMRETFAAMAQNIQAAADAFGQDFTKGLQGIIVDDGEAHAQHQKKRKEMCIPHGNPKSSCRKCHRR